MQLEAGLPAPEVVGCTAALPLDAANSRPWLGEIPAEGRRVDSRNLASNLLGVLPRRRPRGTAAGLEPVRARWCRRLGFFARGEGGSDRAGGDPQSANCRDLPQNSFSPLALRRSVGGWVHLEL